MEKQLNDNIRRLIYEYDPTYRNIYKYKVLNEFEMSYFKETDECRENKQDPNIKRIEEHAIVFLPNGDIRIPSYAYLYRTTKQLKLKKY